MKRMSLNREEGSAMVVTLLVMAVLTGLGAVVFNVGFNNLQNAGRDRLAGGAMGASEGGVAQALAYIRSEGTANLRCDVPPVADTNCSLLWGRDNPKIITLSQNREYRVWIQRIQKINPPTYKTGVYKIHSTGTAGQGPGKRDVELTVVVKPLNYPIGIYADSISDAGTPQIRKESMFSQNCITQRNKITFEGTDPYHGIPAAAHSTVYITNSNNSCSANDNNNIHAPRPPATNPGVCNVSYPNDQDAQGGDLSATTCYNPLGYPKTSFFDLTTLRTYGYQNPRGLTDAEYAGLKSKAQEQGTFYTSTGFVNPSEPPAHANAVYYFDLRAATGSKTVQIQNEFEEYRNDPYCGQRSLVIVVEGGDLHINAGADLVGAVFVPDGNYRGNGNHKIVGTLFARSIDKLNGTADFTLEGKNASCFFDNFPGSLLDVTTARFREVDR